MSQMDNHTDSFRREPPSPLAPRPLNTPVPVEATLPNGLRIVVVEQNRLPLVSFRLVFRKGDAYDPAGLPGLTDIMTHMLAEGTQSRTSREIAEEVARLGASLNAGATSDYTTVAASSLSTYADEVLGLLADISLRPSFPDDELELTKQNAHQNLIAQRAQASFLATETLARVLFGEHPYAVVSPTHESIDALVRSELAGFHAANFTAGGAVLFAVGAVEAGRIVARATELFGGWTGDAPAEQEFPAPPKRDARVAYVVDRPGSAQSNIVIANVGITRTHHEYFPALVMHTVLGATASSRLFMNLREEKGYTYGAYSSLDSRRLAGSFRATAEVRSAVTGDSLKEFFYELERIREEDVTEKELRNAKSYLTGVFSIRLETQEGLIEQLAQSKMYDLPPDYLQTYRDRIEAVTREDVLRVARILVTPGEAAVVVVGDAEEVVEQVKPFAERVEVYDSSGQRKDEGREAEAAPQ
ncbi:MAG TPA: pitrilysin family protein [Pyrinomonadaceae bacterium]|nr:pitrilysin family protein [Pyrinomonadaceae bacterium]